jgi:hypothetical protein
MAPMRDPLLEVAPTVAALGGTITDAASPPFPMRIDESLTAGQVLGGRYRIVRFVASYAS